MDTAVKKSNKENTKPLAGQKRPESRSVISKQKLTKVAPLQSKNDLKEEKKEGNLGEKPEAKEQVKPVTKTNASDPNKRKTLSQAFRTEQSVRHRKLVVEAQKPPPTAPPKPIPGTYKGRVVKSKIDCFRKPPSGEEKTAEATAVAKFTKPSVPKPKPDVGTLSKIRSKSVTTLPGSSRPPRPQPNLPSRTKSVSDVQLNVAEKPIQRSISQRQIPPKAPASARPTVPRPATIPPRPAPVTTARPASSKITSFIRKKEPAVQSVKPKPAAAAVEQKAQRPATGTTSQYRIRMETAEERKAKLAEWLASKGKTLKRPPMTEKAAPPASKPAPPPKATQEPSKVAQLEPQAEPEENQPGCEETSNDQPQCDLVPQSKPVFSSSPSHIMNTTLDLLDSSVMDLPVDPEIRLESLVLNLCDKLDAMEIPSSCESDTKTGDDDDEVEILVNVKVEEETVKEYEILEEEELEVKLESVDDVAVDGQEVKVECEEKVQERKDVKLFKDEVTEEEEEEDDDDSDDEKMDSTPAEVTEASVVKYSVRTTPFLQSVKKRIEAEGETAGSASRRKSAIKDLKFLTPVRRSSRIQRKSSRLPDMLTDHDPCVSSLAELVQLDDADSNAYIYRKNPALLDHLPNQAGDLERLSEEKK
ncbi:cytoskeleton-associated protein 2 isoform X2 [Colossoma macropomum]|uniref:cytoskeleton-associated protein 2 isoform X2 n=1 Tax=Colossoma macropomum TaxID=42526 RepID=UPI0018653915|nr:cytoskeleton-associated protein 2 isoform X2 [Colossoma macropomum]